MKVYVIGQHEPNFGDFDVQVVGRFSVLFPLNMNFEQFTELLDVIERAALEAGAEAVVWQSIPIVAIEHFIAASKQARRLPHWGIVAEPGPRPGRVVQRYPGVFDAHDYNVLARAVSFANGRAKVSRDEMTNEIVVEVDGPPPPFKFVRFAKILEGAQDG